MNENKLLIAYGRGTQADASNNNGGFYIRTSNNTWTSIQGVNGGPIDTAPGATVTEITGRVRITSAGNFTNTAVGMGVYISFSATYTNGHYTVTNVDVSGNYIDINLAYTADTTTVLTNVGGALADRHYAADLISYGDELKITAGVYTDTDPAVTNTLLRLDFDPSRSDITGATITNNGSGKVRITKTGELTGFFVGGIIRLTSSGDYSLNEYDITAFDDLSSNWIDIDLDYTVDSTCTVDSYQSTIYVNRIVTIGVAESTGEPDFNNPLILDGQNTALYGLYGTGNNTYINIEARNCAYYGFNMSFEDVQIAYRCRSHTNGRAGFRAGGNANNIHFHECVAYNNDVEGNASYGNGFYGDGTYNFAYGCVAYDNRIGIDFDSNWSIECLSFNNTEIQCRSNYGVMINNVLYNHTDTNTLGLRLDEQGVFYASMYGNIIDLGGQTGTTGIDLWRVTAPGMPLFLANNSINNCATGVLCGANANGKIMMQNNHFEGCTTNIDAGTPAFNDSFVSYFELSGAPGFVDAASGDYRPAADSILRSAGLGYGQTLDDANKKIAIGAYTAVSPGSGGEPAPAEGAIQGYQLSAMRTYGVEDTVELTLLDNTTGALFAGTLAVGDVQLSLDGGAFANSTNLPVNSSGVWRLTLTAAELQCKRLAIKIVDQEATKTFAAVNMIVETTGNASAQHPYTNVDQVLADITAGELNNGQVITMSKAIRALFTRFYREVTQTSTTQTVKNDSGTNIATMTVSDDGNTQTKASS